MGQTTPNISIYIPAAGETNYDSSFLQGMINVDQHDHSGPPNKGVPISGSGIAPFSITYDKLNANVVLAGGGLAVDGSTQNALKVAGLLLPIFNLGSGGTGLIAQTGANTVAEVKITGTANQIKVVDGDGVGGNPTLSLEPTFFTAGVWTPDLQFGGLNTSITYGTQTGTYTRLGNIVIATFNITLTSKGAQTGAATLAGLPIPAGAGNIDGRSVIVVNVLTLDPGNAYPAAYVAAAASEITLEEWTITGGNNSLLADTNFANTTTLIGTVIYQT